MIRFLAQLAAAGIVGFALTVLAALAATLMLIAFGLLILVWLAGLIWVAATIGGMKAVVWLADWSRRRIEKHYGASHQELPDWFDRP